MKTRAVGPVFLTRDEVDRWDWPNIAGVPANSGGDLRERMLAVLDEVEELRAKVAMLTEALAVTMSALGDSDGDLHCPTTMKTASAALAANSEYVAKWRGEVEAKAADHMLGKCCLVIRGEAIPLGHEEVSVACRTRASCSARAALMR